MYYMLHDMYMGSVTPPPFRSLIVHCDHTGMEPELYMAATSFEVLLGMYLP